MKKVALFTTLLVIVFFFGIQSKSQCQTVIKKQPNDGLINTQKSNSNDISSSSVTSNDIPAFWKSFQIALSNNDTVYIKSVMDFSIIYNSNGNMKTITKNQLFTECLDIFSEDQKEELLKVTSLEKVTRFAYNDFFPTDKKDYKLKDFSSLYRAGTMYNHLSLYFTKFQGEIKLFAIETYWE